MAALNTWGSRRSFEVVIIGGGIAGASLAYFLSERGVSDILLIEREDQPGYHATGRSAAVVVELDPHPTLQQLIVLSADFLRNPPPGFCENPLLVSSGVMVLFREPMWGMVREAAPIAEHAGISLQLLSVKEAIARVPVLSPRGLDGAVFLADDGRLDVHELLSSYLRHARRGGVEQRFGVEVLGIRADRGRCRGVITADGTIDASWVVDAAGAWAGKLAELAGAAPIALVPHRRTIVTFAAPDDLDASGWPFVGNESDLLYFAPESGGFLLSPMDEDPMEPCDAAPDDLVVAEAIERLAALAPRLVPRSLRRKWAGLRTFAPDRVPVVGEDPRLRGFFWLAGQGGCGIETSPIMGRIAADLISCGRTDLFDERELAPARFATA